LKDPRAVQLRKTLTAIEPRCLDAAFEEMQADGFADDGLFQKIKEFFFTLTISDQDLNSQWSSSSPIQQDWSIRHDRLVVNIKQLKKDIQSEQNTHQKCLDKIQQVKKNIKDEEANQKDILAQLRSAKPTKRVMRNLQRVLSITSRATKKIKEETPDLNQLLKESERKQSELKKELNQLTASESRSLQCISDWEKQIEDKTRVMEMIKNKLNTPHEPINKQLVKPPRGLILYGPPGKFRHV
jgi:DNA repair exonuclease SbcCD ATPase subunit